MEKSVTIHRLLGLPRNASLEEMERQCEALLDWLESESIPEDLRPWASSLHALVQETYESLPLAEEEAGAGKRPEKAPRPTVKKVSAGGRRGPLLGLLWQNPLTLVAIGVALGLVVGALWWTGVIFRGQEKAQHQPGRETVQPSQILESRQERIKELEGIVAANPGDVDAVFELGETHMLGENWEEAIRWFTWLLEIDPTNLHARLDIGTANMNLGNYGEAEAAFSQVLAMEPENVQAHYNTGFLFAFRRDLPDVNKAVEHWQEVIRLAPGSELAEVAQGHIQQLRDAGLIPEGTE